MKRIALATLSIIITFALSGLGRAIVLDPDKSAHPVLSPLAEHLDAVGIDVVLNNKSAVQRRNQRAIVAPLDDFQTSLFLSDDKFINQFRAGTVGAVVAIPSSKTSLSSSEFEQRWRAATPDKRVFISFAREDVVVAQKLKATLESRGFVAFVYLERFGDLPPQSPEAVGRFLKEAHIRLVLDTKVSRRKPGVLVEALLHSELKDPPGGPDPDHAAPQGREPKDKGPSQGGVSKAEDGIDPAHRDHSTQELERLRETLRRMAEGNDPPKLNPFAPGLLDPNSDVPGHPPAGHVIEIYGATNRCPRTRQALELFGKTDAVVRYYDVDSNPTAAAVVNNNSKYLLHGDTLPLIKMDGNFIHPSQTEIGAALKACQ